MSKSVLIASLVSLLLCTLAFHFRYLFMKSEVRHGTLVFDVNSRSSDCHLVDTKRDADTQWAVTENFGKGPLTEDARARMFRVSDGLEASFCKDHPELLHREIAVVGVRVTGEAIGQDCTNRSCFRWVRLAAETSP